MSGPGSVRLPKPQRCRRSAKEPRPRANAGLPLAELTELGETPISVSRKAGHLQKMSTNSFVQRMQVGVASARPECRGLRQWPHIGSRCNSSGRVRATCEIEPSIHQRLEMLERSCAALADERNADRKRSEDLHETVVKLQERRAIDQRRIALCSQALTNVSQLPHPPGSAARTLTPETRTSCPQIFGISTPQVRSPSARHCLEEFVISTPRKTAADLQAARQRKAKSPKREMPLKRAKTPRRATWSCASQSLRHLASSVSVVDPLRLSHRILAKVLLSQEQWCLVSRHRARVAAFGFVLAAWQCGRSDMCLWARAIMSVAASPNSCFGRLPVSAQQVRAFRRALICIAAVASLTGMPSWVHVMAILLSRGPLSKALCR